MKTIFTFLLAGASLAGFSQINDGSFEAGSGSGNWIEASSTFGTPLCDAGCGTNAAPYVGTWYAWFGGVGATEVGSLEQSSVIPSGTTATLKYRLQLGTVTGMAEDNFIVTVDGNEVFNLPMNSADTALYAGTYVLVNADVSAYADGNSHTINFTGTESGLSGGTANFLLDDVSLSVDGASVNVFEILNDESVTIFTKNNMVNVVTKGLSGAANISIYSINGALVNSERVTVSGVSTHEFNTLNLENGVYIVNVENNGKTTTDKIIITK